MRHLLKRANLNRIKEGSIYLARFDCTLRSSSIEESALISTGQRVFLSRKGRTMKSLSTQTCWRRMGRDDLLRIKILGIATPSKQLPLGAEDGYFSLRNDVHSFQNSEKWASILFVLTFIICHCCFQSPPTPPHPTPPPQTCMFHLVHKAMETIVLRTLQGGRYQDSILQKKNF